jgi:hypothetical protein
MKAGGYFWPVVQVTNPTTGSAVTGLASGSWTVTCYLNGTVTALTVAWTEIGGGAYKAQITLPATAGYLVITIANGTNLVSPNRWEGANTLRDVDDAYNASSKAVAYITAVTGTPYTDTLLALDANRAQTITVQVNNQAGAGIDLSGYTNWAFTVWDKTHSSTSTRTIITNGISGTSGGVLTVAVPETSGFFSLIDAAITAGNDTVTLYYDVKADAGGVSTNTQNIIRGTITLRRYEGAA